MSKVTKIGLVALMALLLGGFIYVALIDIPVNQSEVIQTIPNDRFFKDR